MAELGALLAARWRMLRAAGMYWLLAVGYDPEIRGLSNRIYALYLLLLLPALGALIWLEVLSAAVSAGKALAAAPGPEPLPALLLGVVPGLIGGIQLAGAALAWWTTPLRMTWPEIAYVAGAPLPAAAIVASALLRRALLALPIAAVLGALAAVVLTGGDRTALSAAALAFAAGLTVMGLDWLVGMTRLAVGWLRPRRWLAAVAALALAAAGHLLPAAGLWPGRLLAGVIAGAPLWPAVGWLGAAGLALAAGAMGISRWTSMIDVVDESGVYARLAAYAPADRRDPAVRAQVRAQAHRGRRRAWLRLPEARAAGMLAARAGLGRLRRPAQLLYLAEDLALALSATWMLADPGIPRPWLPWLIVAVAVPPRGLGDAFIADVEEPFLRQLLPPSDLAVLVADEGLPFLLLAAIAIAAWLVGRPPSGGVAVGTLLLPALLALRVACRGLAARVQIRARTRLPFAAAAVLAYGLVLLLGLAAGAPWAALFVAAILGAGMCAVLARSG